MNLHVTIKDENGTELDFIEILQDGSDGQGSEKVRELVRQNFRTVSDPNYDEFECSLCERIFDIDDSIKVDDELRCEECATAKCKVCGHAANDKPTGSFDIQFFDQIGRETFGPVVDGRCLMCRECERSVDEEDSK